MIDLSVVFGALIALLLAVMMFKVWPMIQAFLPPVVIAVIQWIARSVVDGVESDLRGESGAVKREEAFERIEKAIAPLLSYMENRGYTVSAYRIYEAIEAAWRQLNTEQLLTGEKELTPDPDDQEEEPEEELQE